MTLILKRRDLNFILYDLLRVEELCDSDQYGDYSRDVFDQVIDAAEKLAVQDLYPIAKETDSSEPIFDNGSAILPDSTHAAISKMRDGGFFGASFDPKWGGLGLPYVIAQGISAYFGAANQSLLAYSALTGGAANLLAAHASEEQAAKFVAPLVEGRFFGTMCLSEPQAGSSLADIRTKAVAAEDGTYRLSGNKMWISGGDHALSENIIHLVLAKIPGGESGIRGISLFIVPKYMVNDDGSLGEQNDVTLVGVNHKMGNRGTVNTALSFGDSGGAVGYLVGKPGLGLSYMFHMMNEARVGVGLGAATLAYTGYLHALEYAKDRKQGRSLTARDTTQDMIPIIEHADVKRMLLQQKAYAEGALALVLYGANLIDQLETVTKPDEKARIQNLLEVLTPIMKSWPSEFGLRANEQAIQVHGGYGYTREYPVERFYRDNRLNPIHEGTKGIHGLDLLGRKVLMQGGAALATLEQEIFSTVEIAKEDATLAPFYEQLSKAWAEVKDIASELPNNFELEGKEAALANSTLYLDAFGHVIVAWLWLWQAITATQTDHPVEFKKGKIQACKYFYAYELSTIYPACGLLRSVDKTCWEMEQAWF
ncbi:MAG: acyl-CoA dehydrogenase [Parasphingorhabdus sp.]